MKKEYKSPDIEIVSYCLVDVLNSSIDETITSGGTIINPESELEDDWP